MAYAVCESWELLQVLGKGRRKMAQLPIPARIDGFVYRKAPVWGRSVVVEAFLDPLCPDSRDSWPPLKQAISYYSSAHVAVVAHPFPLP
ncbi:hypothetical protein ACMD2_13719 [Ananas comosus]|uniref:Thioredoxin-like fold domain-containing protein n=1 Tax=Ananas comosus TaxID=4615 RepID=A0A199V0W7_ANACO|nr:hypothetical protein ACMD2_13719 [Ananas comosus]